VQVSQFSNGLDRNDADRMLCSGDQDRPMLPEQFTTPAALTPLFRGRETGAFQQHDRGEIIEMSRPDADLRVAKGVAHRRTPG
jgi:hypothetical protein